jgi:RNA ligase
VSVFDLDTLREYESHGLVKSSADALGFTVWCYTQTTAYGRHWDPVTRACRGLILSPDGDLVARPFPKFHNYGEPEATLERGAFYAFDKMDGTLIVVGNHDGTPVVSTKGSFGTWHSAAARDLLFGFAPPEGHTAIFELIHPDNRIVVDYEGYEGLIFLGGLTNETGADTDLPEIVAEEWGWHGDVVARRQFNLQNMLSTIQNPEAGPNREGFVVAWRRENEPWNRVKLKFAQYVGLHRIMTGLTNRRVWEAMVDGTFDAFLEVIPDEMFDDVTAVAAGIDSDARDIYVEALHLGQEAYSRFKQNRKAVAEFILKKADRPVSGLAFKAYDGKLTHLDALKLVRPDESKPVGSAGLS